MAIVAITDQQMIFSTSFFTYTRIKTPLQPLQSMIIACPFFLVKGECPAVMNACRNPYSWYILCLENKQGRTWGSIGTNTFNWCYPLLATPFGLKFLPYLCVNDDFRCFNFSDWKLAFIYVVNVLERCKGSVELLDFMSKVSQQDWRFISTWQLFDSMQTLP